MLVTKDHTSAKMSVMLVFEECIVVFCSCFVIKCLWTTILIIWGRTHEYSFCRSIFSFRLTEQCWAPDMNHRPPFLEILKRLEKIKETLTSDHHWHLFSSSWAAQLNIRCLVSPFYLQHNMLGFVNRLQQRLATSYMCMKFI